MMNQQHPTSIYDPRPIRTFNLGGTRICAMEMLAPGTQYAWVAWPKAQYDVERYGHTLFEAVGAVLVDLADETQDGA
jgi:hypothetical protein